MTTHQQIAIAAALTLAGIPSAVAADPQLDYRVLATSKTSTMEKDLNEAAQDGFILVGFTVAKTALGGDEIVSILKKNNHAAQSEN